MLMENIVPYRVIIYGGHNSQDTPTTESERFIGRRGAEEFIDRNMALGNLRPYKLYTGANWIFVIRSNPDCLDGRIANNPETRHSYLVP